MMKFARFAYEGNVFLGMVREEEITVLDGSLFDGYEETKARYPLSDVKLLPPVLPSKIVCIGRNYRGHIEEIGAEVPEEPEVFLKPPSSLIGHEDAIIYPRSAERVDYEGELAVVIKEKMKDVPEGDTLNHVLGCSCFNDVTERALVVKDPILLIVAKGFDTFSPFGPYIVTDLDPNNLECMTLYPGDIVTTGTPKGVAPMRPGDVVEVEVEGIGRLRNTVKAA
jgi:2-keto-4-pentenoate hydratase/2-oxohepta-3-ene-1,7-dioic acid hydratase in catechol pathway